MRPEDFDYALPPDRIAQHPPPRRSDARLLAVGPPHVHGHVRALPSMMPPEALLVINDSRVVPARIFAERADGRQFELLVSAPGPTLQPGAELTAWVRGAKRLRVDDVLRAGSVQVRYRGRDPDDRRACRFAILEGQLGDALRDHGNVPLPPYIERAPTPEDRERYQTVYARAEGSVAAPTAGLHFDADLLARFEVASLTLHVGPGTFLPMETEDVRDHRVGGERMELSPETAARIRTARRRGRPIVAVGTTVTRALESVAALHGGVVMPHRGVTDLVITPEHRFRAADWLLTNFHLPKSSLLMLVCSFGGRERVLDAYRDAIREGYRFYSYGDCMLIDRRPSP